LTILNGDGNDVRVYCRGTSGASPAERGHAGIPGTISLSVWPNPGNAIFSIGYEIPAARPVNLRVYDLTGRLVETLTEESVAAGSHRIEWNAAGQASGLYFVRLETDDGIFITRKLMLIR